MTTEHGIMINLQKLQAGPVPVCSAAGTWNEPEQGDEQQQPATQKTTSQNSKYTNMSQHQNM